MSKQLENIIPINLFDSQAHVNVLVGDYLVIALKREWNEEERIK